MNQEKEQLKVEKQMLNTTYVGFGKRLGAYLLDLLILTPVILVLTKLQINFRQSGNYLYLLFNVFATLITYSYRIIFNAKFGATPGKMICKIKITAEDGTNLTFKKSFMRESIYILYSVISYLSMTAALLYFIQTTEVHSADMYQTFYNKTVIMKIQMLIMYGIYIADFILFRASSKKQSLHDRIAKTVVVYKR